MINLLPTDIKQDITYARRNTQLRRWILACVVALAGIGIIIAGGMLYMQQSIKNVSGQVQTSKQSLKAQNVAETQKRVEEISTNTKLATQVLSREILFSKLLPQIGFALPVNTSLTALQIDKLQGGIQLNASAADFNAATQIQVNLQDPKNGVFEKADLNNISCDTPGGEEVTGYPCNVNLRALFGKNTSFYFIAPTTGDAKQ